MNDTHKPIKSAIWRGFAGTLLIAGIAGCAGIALTEIAPPVVPAMTNSNNDAHFLSCGREIYLTRCARCHVAPAIRKYSQTVWAHRLPEMSRLSKLNTLQESELRAYVMAVIGGEGTASAK